MNIPSVTAAAVCAAIVALSIKSIKPEIGQLVSIAAVAAVLAAMLPYISEVISAIKELSTYSNMGVRYIEPILKITAIAYISQIGSEICAESGEKALAAKVEAAGKIAICTIAIPVAREAFVKIMGILT